MLAPLKKSLIQEQVRVLVNTGALTEQDYSEVGELIASRSNSNPQQLTTKKDAADFLHISMPTLNNLIASGRLTAVRFGKRNIRLNEHDVHALAAGRAV